MHLSAHVEFVQYSFNLQALFLHAQGELADLNPHNVCWHLLPDTSFGKQ